MDRHITGSGRGLYDLYLISQQAIQGTARPAHYTVIRRGINAIDVDAFERITNALCYMWQRSPRSVSYCPPAYYADVLAERGRMYLIRYMVDPGNEQVWTLNNSEWNGQVMPSVKEKMWFV